MKKSKREDYFQCDFCGRLAINFIRGLELQNLKTLSSLNSFGFKDLTLPRQRKFKRISDIRDRGISRLRSFCLERI